MIFKSLFLYLFNYLCVYPAISDILHRTINSIEFANKMFTFR